MSTEHVCRVQAELAEESKKVGELQTEIDRLRETLKEIHDATKELPNLGALLTPAKIRWAAAWIKERREGCPLPEHVRDWFQLSSECIEWHEWCVEAFPGRPSASLCFYQVTRAKGGARSIVAKAYCRTIKGGLRLGVKAARRAWRLGVGR